MKQEVISPVFLPSDIETCHSVIKSLHQDIDGDILSKKELLRAMDSAASQARLRELELQEQIEYWKAKAARLSTSATIKPVYKD